jgi:molecular chaperone DnaK (HSP70)
MTYLKKKAESHLKKQFQYAIITVPTYLSEPTCSQTILDAAEFAGLTV